jgi:N-glycosylase/DNA lyase
MLVLKPSCSKYKDLCKTVSAQAIHAYDVSSAYLTFIRSSHFASIGANKRLSGIRVPKARQPLSDVIDTNNDAYVAQNIDHAHRHSHLNGGM